MGDLETITIAVCVIAHLCQVKNYQLSVIATQAV